MTPVSCDPNGPGFKAELALSPPAQGSYYLPGEAPTLTIKLASSCGRLLMPSELGTANLYLVGPRGALTIWSVN